MTSAGTGAEAGGATPRDGMPAPGARRGGVRLGVDVGTVRIGVALSDPAGILATPLATLARDSAGRADLDSLARLVAEHEVVEVVVGLPRTLRGEHGVAAAAAEAYGRRLARRVEPVPVVYADERLTTVTANRILRERGVPGRARRAVVDQLAAVRILQNRLDGLVGPSGSAASTAAASTAPASTAPASNGAGPEGTASGGTPSRGSGR